MIKTSLLPKFIVWGLALSACQHPTTSTGTRRPGPPNDKSQKNNPITFGSGPFTGNATHFDGLGELAGGCGVPQQHLETQNFVALNVQHTPGQYGDGHARPISQQYAHHVGAFENGRNCGRWVQVTIGDYCTGNNNGQPGAGFCHGAGESPWVSDHLNGASLEMLVADSCQDGNGWCRDDAHHLDLSTSSLTQFRKDGETMTELPQKWGNRRVHWQYIPAPSYSGDIKLALARDAQRLWLPLVVTHLENGIHGVEAWVDGQWKSAQMVSDNGQVYQLPGGINPPYRIRIYDADDHLINQGRIYSFDFPTECGERCTATYNAINYSTE